jgi:hypothetical protein
MTSSNFDNSPEKQSDEPKPDANKQPSFEPKRVIHLSKPLSPTGEGSKGPTSIFRRRQSKQPETGNPPEVNADGQRETPTENAKAEGFPTRGDQKSPPIDGKNTNPGLRLRAFVTAGNNAPASKPKTKFRQLFTRDQSQRVFWNVAAGISLVINAILVVTLVIMGNQNHNLKTTVNGLLNGLYGNFVEMENASITTTLTVDTQVPIDFMLPIQQNTDMTLTQSVEIPNAHVIINTPGLTLDGSASINLPAGTTLPIGLNVAVPVQFSVPVTLQIPVNIPMAQTGLHQSLTGLQETVRAYYCTFDKNAQYPQGVYICENHDGSTPAPGIP